MRHPIRRETTTVICALLLVSLFEVSCQGRVFHRAVHGPMVGHTTSEEALIWIRTGYPTIVRVRFGLDPSRLTQLSE
ncbi:MAG: hypothetical protein KC609_10785, partial [Myxococcales bacterium]|nr:hypothetical protein [Myxococcales bacterium]